MNIRVRCSRIRVVHARLFVSAVRPSARRKISRPGRAFPSASPKVFRNNITTVRYGDANIMKYSKNTHARDVPFNSIPIVNVIGIILLGEKGRGRDTLGDGCRGAISRNAQTSRYLSAGVFTYDLRFYVPPVPRLLPVSGIRGTT